MKKLIIEILAILLCLIFYSAEAMPKVKCLKLSVYPFYYRLYSSMTIKELNREYTFKLKIGENCLSRYNSFDELFSKLINNTNNVEQIGDFRLKIQFKFNVFKKKTFYFTQFGDYQYGEFFYNGNEYWEDIKLLIPECVKD